MTATKKFEVTGSRWEKQDFRLDIEAKNATEAKQKAISAAQSLDWDGLDAWAEIDSTATPKIQRDNLHAREV